jgi:hypothetical protein
LDANPKLSCKRSRPLDMLSCNFGPGNSQHPVPETAWRVLARSILLEAAVEALRLEEPTGHPFPIHHNRRPTWLDMMTATAPVSMRLPCNRESEGFAGKQGPHRFPVSVPESWLRGLVLLHQRSSLFTSTFERQCIGFRPRRRICGDGHGSAAARRGAARLSRMRGVE